MKEKIIGASWFQTYDFCEYKFYLHKVKGLKLELTKQIKEGLNIHSEKEQEFLKEAELISLPEFIHAEEPTITKELELYYKLGDIIILGKVDEILIDKEKVQIIEDKPKAYPFNSSKLQLYTYCYLFNKSGIAEIKCWGK